MASSNETASSSILTKHGSMRVVVLDTVGPDRIYEMLLKGSMAARYGRTTDKTPLVSREIKDLLIHVGGET